MTSPGNITLVYIDRNDLFGPSEKMALAIPRGISYENFRATATARQLRRLEGFLEVKQPPERILVTLSRLHAPSQAGSPDGPGRQPDDCNARVYKLDMPGANPRCREGTEPQDVFDEMVRHLERRRDVHLLLQRPWHLDSACMAGDDTDDMDIEDHQKVLPQFSGNRDLADGPSARAPHEGSIDQNEVPLDESDTVSETGGSRRQSLSSSIAGSDRTTLSELSEEEDCSTPSKNAPKQAKDMY
ncbi:hypothetical protein PpBr36_00564 [Pyricularia pennisetigena]|uniref:hypothetical protein n=1 Tax=Pyricularia pennisetigena TaxID=1578925 RepID=UPI0011516520|nr:hypothetical protein PpBr36_00564 [Pyricularia pennisetigena]TLS28941.1 hypothetical protein PpBr36_00564 [Pyricularia pennisetigena]